MDEMKLPPVPGQSQLPPIPGQRSKPDYDLPGTEGSRTRDTPSIDSSTVSQSGSHERAKYANWLYLLVAALPLGLALLVFWLWPKAPSAPRVQLNDIRPKTTLRSTTEPNTPVESKEPNPAATPLPTVASTPPIVDAFSTDPSEPTAGEFASISWQVRNAAKVDIRPVPGRVLASGLSRVKIPEGATRLVLRAIGSDGKIVQRGIDVGRPQPPRILAFSSDRPSARAGQTALLSWDIEGATSVRLEPGFPNLPVRGTQAVIVQADTAFSLIAVGPGGEVSRSVRIGLDLPPPSPPPSITNFTAIPQTIPACTTTVLQWETHNASAVRITPPGRQVPASGTLEADPGVSTTYVLTSEGPGGTSRRAINVNVMTGSSSNCGTLLWTGIVPLDGRIVILNNQTIGDARIEGNMPRSPVAIEIQESGFSILEPPSASNRYSRLVLRSERPGQPQTVHIRWRSVKRNWMHRFEDALRTK